MLLGVAAQGTEFSGAGVGEEDVDSALFALDLIEQTVEVVQIRNIALHTYDVASDLFDGRVESGLTAAGDVDEGAFCDEALCGRETDAAVAARNHCDLSGEFSHGDLVYFSVEHFDVHRTDEVREGQDSKIKHAVFSRRGRKGTAEPCPDEA